MTNEELKKIREEKNQGKGEFAKSLGVTPMVYGRYESGTLKIPENIEDAVKKTTILIQSQLGGTITPEEVLKRIPDGCDQVYIKPEENKAYWVKGDESGAVELW